jgi:DNA-binding CsgD family transcriptional regulator
MVQILLACFMVLISGPFTFLFGQETPPITTFSSSQYQAHNQNWEISQAKDLLIYTANSDGLLQFDGSMWKLYPLPNGQIVRTVLANAGSKQKLLKQPDHFSEDRIYVGGFGEFGYWLKNKNGLLEYHSLSKNLKLPSLDTEEIWHILRTSDYIYFQSFAYIYRYDGQTITEIKGSSSFMFLKEVHQKLLIQFIGEGLYELKGDQFTFVPGTELLAQTTVTSIIPLGNTKILVTTSKHGLFILEYGNLQPWDIPISAELKKNILNRAILLHYKNEIALGTIQNGVYIIQTDGKLKYYINKENGLQNNTVLSLYEDSNLNLWVGLDQGIDFIQLNSPLRHYETTENPLGTTYASAIWNNNLYVGSNKGVFVKKWNSDDFFRPIKGLEGQTWNLKVVNGQLLCGHNDGTFLITEKGAKKISNINGGWVFLPIATESDSLILQGSYNGLHVYQLDAQKKWSYGYAVKGIAPLPIKQIVRDNDGTFWLGHAYKGLYHAQLTPQLDTVLSLKNLTPPKDIPNIFSVALTRLNEKTIIQSGNAFFETTQNGKLIRSTLFKQDLNEQPFQLKAGIDSDWFKVFNNHVVYYNNHNPPISLDLNMMRNNQTIIPLTLQDYFFSLDNGYALYHVPLSQEQTLPTVSSFIRGISNLSNISQTFPINSHETYIPPHIRSIRITYAMPLYGHTIQFSYRLKGLSDQWSEWRTQNFADYTNLEAKSYIFELRNNYNKLITTYHIQVKPYWFETLWVRIIFLLIGAGLLVFIILYQERRAKKHHQKIINEQNEKIKQERLLNESKIMEIQNEQLHHEIRTKSQQISNVAINIVRKNEILEEIRRELTQVKEELGNQLPTQQYQKLLNSIERNVAGKEDWTLFEENFDEIHDQFFIRLKKIYPTITPSELKLAACLRMNLSTKEMAPALGISIRGVEIKRYRLRKKLELDTDANLVEFMMQI